MSKVIRLRCQYGSGERTSLDGLTESSSILELQALIFSITHIMPTAQKIKSGFPPKLLDVSNTTTTVKDCGIRSGDTLIVEGKVVSNSQGCIVRKVVPADNSCLFASVGFVLLNDTSYADFMRQLAAKCISSDLDKYTEAFLGKSNKEYCEWLTDRVHWGGAIELNVISEYYGVEINVADVQSGRIDRYGEMQHHPNRTFLLYDGIHYDPLGLQEGGEIVQTVFSTDEPRFQSEVLALAENLKKQRQFTDVSGFSLRCMICNTPLQGQSQAQAHAKQTGHMNFGEV